MGHSECVWPHGLHLSQSIATERAEAGTAEGLQQCCEGMLCEMQIPRLPELLNPPPGVGLGNLYFINTLPVLFSCVSRHGSHQQMRKSPSFTFWVQAPALLLPSCLARHKLFGLSETQFTYQTEIHMPSLTELG